MTRARDRLQQRRQEREMVRVSSRNRQQIQTGEEFKMPQIRLPGGRWLLLIPAAVLLVGIVVFVLAFINPPETTTPPNAIWLDARWSHQDRSSDEIGALMSRLQRSDIGTIYLYASSLSPDNTWAGLTAGDNRFLEVEPILRSFMERARAAYPAARIYAWIEVLATTADGYRLDRPEVQSAVAAFSSRMIADGFDGVLLDVRPIFEENADLPQLIRSVRAAIGLGTPLIVSVPPDLTPLDTTLRLPAVIAPGTQWSAEYKQRIALQADQIVIQAFNSYQTDPVAYIEWVSYQVTSYVDALSAIGSGTTITVSVPEYAERLPAHDPAIESLSGALDGVSRAVLELDETTLPFFAGVAIFADRDLQDADWQIFSDKWLR
jgi:hypothetical protein